MEHNVYKHITVTGTSADSQDDAVRKAVTRAAKTVHNMRWFEIAESRGHIENGKIVQWQVTVKIGFTLD